MQGFGPGNFRLPLLGGENQPLGATPHGMARIAPLVALAVIQLVALWSPAMRQETPRRDDDPVGRS